MKNTTETTTPAAPKTRQKLPLVTPTDLARKCVNDITAAMIAKHNVTSQGAIGEEALRCQWA